MSLLWNSVNVLTITTDHNAVSGLNLLPCHIRRRPNPKIGHKRHAGLQSHRNLYSRALAFFKLIKPEKQKFFIKKWIIYLRIVWRKCIFHATKAKEIEDRYFMLITTCVRIEFFFHWYSVVLRGSSFPRWKPLSYAYSLKKFFKECYQF